MSAESLFEDFHEYPPGKGEIVTVSQDAPEKCLLVGEFYGIMYKTKETKEPYLHKFGARQRPKVYVSADGKQIYIVGGKYKFTDRGFIG